MTRPSCRTRRNGSMLPLLAVSIISLFAFVALAVDLGMLAVSRTQCQNAADVSALTGCRTLNNKTGSVNSNLANAVDIAMKTVSGDPAVANSANVHLSAQFTSSQISKIETGQYLYDATAQRFKVGTWTDVTSSQSATPSSGSWTAMRTTLAVTQPTYFMKVFGVTTMPSGASATAVYRARDVAFVLDMTGSMAYATTFNDSGLTGALNASLNADTLVPNFGHYSQIQDKLIASSNKTNGNGEAISRNNFTMTTPGGPPIARNFYFDPVNVSTPATSAYPVTSTISNLRNAFHRWTPPETPGNPTNYVPQTYDFTGYNPMHNGTEAVPKGPTPAPPSYGTMTDAGAITYKGDRYRRADGSINKVDTTWAIGAANTRVAATAAELLGYSVSGTNILKGTSGSGAVITTVDKFRDPVWETYGYDLDIVAYRAWKTASNADNPGTATLFSTLLTGANVNEKFLGYSMGPGYYGKTFYAWPPDPRFDTTANLTSPDATKPGFDTSGKAMCDWRRHFFLTSASAAYPAGSTAATAGIDATLFRTSGSGWPLSDAGCKVNYPAVLKWIKTGPQVIPPNLRAGRVLYYSSIPDDVTTSGSTQVDLDKVFWKNYIDYALGMSMSSYSSKQPCLYGYGDNLAGTFALSIYTAGNLNPWTGPTGLWAGSTTGSGAITPYMSYADSPLRPRLQFWFGPLSMMDFIANMLSNKSSSNVNWNPGTCNEAQCWQLKAGMNSVLGDVQANHPNDYVGLTMFSYGNGAYKNPRVSTGQDFVALKNALFYPKSLLSAINAGDTTSEIRPFNSSFTSVAIDEIPNANGGTDPNTGLAVAFNLLSPSASLPAAYLTTVNGVTVKGRRGAAKIVIFETDGVPNSYSNYTLNKAGYDTYYSNFTDGGSPGNGTAGAINPAIAVVQQMAKPLAATNGGGLDSGLSLPNAPVRVYPIAFGDLFDPVAAPSATFRPTALQFLANLAIAGNTASAGATTIPANQIITGPYDQRITRLRDCMQSIFQSGVAVTLIE